MMQSKPVTFDQYVAVKNDGVSETRHSQAALHAADDARKRLREEGPPPTQAEEDRRQVELIEALLDKHGVEGPERLRCYNPTPYARLRALFGEEK